MQNEVAMTLKTRIAAHVDKALSGTETPEQVAQRILDEIISPAEQLAFERREDAFQGALQGVLDMYGALLKTQHAEFEREREARRKAERGLRDKLMKAPEPDRA